MKKQQKPQPKPPKSRFVDEDLTDWEVKDPQGSVVKREDEPDSDKDAKDKK